MLLTTVLGVALFATPPLPATAQSGAEKEVREIITRANAAYAANDLPSYWSFYAAELTQWWPSGRVDLPSYQKMWTKFISEGGRIEAAEVLDLQVQVGPGGDASVASYLLRVRMRDSKGQVTTEENHETDVLFKRDGAWKIVHLHYSPAPKKNP